MTALNLCLDGMHLYLRGKFMLMTRLLLLIKTEVDEFHNHVNDIEAGIKFIREHEANNSIPFLDVCVTRKGSWELMTRI